MGWNKGQVVCKSTCPMLGGFRMRWCFSYIGVPYVACGWKFGNRY